MARPTLLRHRKFSRLSRVLGSKPLARGVLELLWESCYESGDECVGSADDVADIVGWSDPSVDIAAVLADCRWLDRRRGHPGEFVVHDLWDHAPDYVKKRWKREMERRKKGKALRELAESDRQTADSDHQTADNGEVLPYEQTEVVRTPAPAPAPALKDQDPALTGGIAPCGNVENSALPQAARSTTHAARVITALVRTMVAEDPSVTGSDLKEAAKSRCAQLGLPYDARLVNIALDAVEHIVARVGA